MGSLHMGVWVLLSDPSVCEWLSLSASPFSFSLCQTGQGFCFANNRFVFIIRDHSVSKLRWRCQLNRLVFDGENWKDSLFSWEEGKYEQIERQLN